MKVLFFVYSDATLEIGGTDPVKKFEFGTLQSFHDVEENAVTPPAAVTLSPGIYVIWTDSDAVLPPITPSGSSATINYDIVAYAGKDGWPVPPGVATVNALAQLGKPALSAEEFDAIVARARGAFSDQLDRQLERFVQSLSV